MSEPVLPSPDASERAGLIAAGVLGVAWAVFPALLGFWLLAEIGVVSEWLEAHSEGGIWIYIGVFALSSGLGLLPTYAQSILGGWVFGLAAGIPAAMGGLLGGAVVGYLIGRLVARQSIETFIAKRPRSAVVRESLIGHGYWKSVLVVTLLRMPPNSPFALSNLAMAAAGVRLGPFLMGTALGTLPRSAVVVGLAHAASSAGATDIQSFVKQPGGGWILAAGVVTTVVVIAIIGAMAKAALRRVLPASGSGEQR